VRWDDIYVAGCATALGDREDVAAAVAAGRYAAADMAADGYRSVCATGAGMAVDLAVAAAVVALARSGVAPGDVGLILHASCGPQGPDQVAPASYLQGRSVGGTGCALEVKQFSNGAMAALELGAAHLSAGPAPAAALLSTSDTFRLPAVDRYRSDPGNVLADGGTALVLARGGGVAALLSTAVLGDGAYSDVRVGDAAWTGADRERFLVEHGQRLLAMVGSMSQLQRRCVARALEEAGTASAEVGRWVFANIGEAQVDQEFRKAFGIDPASTTWEWGRTVGHLGAGDQVAGLTHLLETGALGAGERVALCGMGSGFSFSCAVLEVVVPPRWDAEEAA
jgi:3-oxoacyl-[acyl-carrier-protein] synthase-3